jgi:pimeloyl-ACP methyl ester carboxylesterase
MMCRQWMAVVVSSASVACLGACGSNPAKGFEPVLGWGECPADVEVTFISRHECGTLTVLEDRAQPNGPTVDLLVVKVWPVGVDEPPPEFGTGVGGNIGDPRLLSGGIATGATRWGRIVVQMEARGAGPHSSPSLRCVEADDLAVRSAGARSGDPELEAAFVEAVGSCATRLRTAGIEPAAYGVADTAADLEDLRVALGLDHWAGIGSEGTTSRVLFEYVRMYPERVTAAVTDSPWFPDVDDLTGGVIGTRTALAELFDVCSADPSCETSYPHLDQTWESALDRLTDHPIHTTYRGGDGAPIAVLVDAAKLLRAARFALGGDGPADVAELPATIAAAADGQATDWIVSTLAEDPTFCVGYRPFCTAQSGFSLGTYLTAFCGDQGSLIDDDALTNVIDGDPVYDAVFARSPYRAVCRAWDVPSSDPAIAEPVDTEVPLLMLSGQFDSFSPLPPAAAAADRSTTSWSVTIAAQTHNVLGFAQCAGELRDDWRRHPTTRPDVENCPSSPPIRLETDGLP